MSDLFLIFPRLIFAIFISFFLNAILEVSDLLAIVSFCIPSQPIRNHFLLFIPIYLTDTVNLFAECCVTLVLYLIPDLITYVSVLFTNKLLIILLLLLFYLMPPWHLVLNLI